MIENFPRVSVIILNYNGEKFLIDCLSSVLRSSYSNFEIILVDNGSTDNSISIVEERFGYFPLLRIVKNYANLGFAEGNNIGVSYSKGKYILFLNNDTLVEPNWLIELVNVLESDPKIGVAQSKLLSLKDKKTLDSAGDFLDYYGLSIRRGSWGVDNGQYDQVDEIFSARGAALIVKSQIFKEIGGFDANFFLCYEDIDLCWRIRNSGHKIVFVPNSKVYHIGSASAIASSTNVFHIEKNRFLTLAKNMPLKYLIKYNPLTFTASEMIGDLIFKRPALLSARLKAILWVMIRLKKIWRERVLSQGIQRIKDEIVEKYFLKTNFRLLLKFFVVQSQQGETQALKYYFSASYRSLK